MGHKQLNRSLPNGVKGTIMSVQRCIPKTMFCCIYTIRWKTNSFPPVPDASYLLYKGYSPEFETVCKRMQFSWLNLSLTYFNHIHFSITVNIGNVDNEKGMGYPIAEMIAHPNYTNLRRSYKALKSHYIYNDIALFRVNGPIKMTGNDVMPVCLPFPGRVEDQYRQCFVTGWGSTVPERRGLSFIVYKLLVRLIVVTVGDPHIGLDS